MKLTSTNRSIDLIVPITNAHLYLPMQLVQKVEHLFGRMGCKQLCCLNITFVLTPHAPSALAADSAGNTGGKTRRARRAVALAVLRTEIFSLDKPSMRKEFEAEGFARPTGRRRIYLGQIAYPKSRTTFWASDRLRRARAGQIIKDDRYGRERKQINPSFSNLLFADLVVMAG